jgi:hypothetical protein
MDILSEGEVETIHAALDQTQESLAKAIKLLDAYAAVQVIILPDGSIALHTATGVDTGDIDTLAVAIGEVVHHMLFDTDDKHLH